MSGGQQQQSAFEPGAFDNAAGFSGGSNGMHHQQQFGGQQLPGGYGGGYPGYAPQMTGYAPQMTGYPGYAPQMTGYPPGYAPQMTGAPGSMALVPVGEFLDLVGSVLCSCRVWWNRFHLLRAFG